MEDAFRTLAPIRFEGSEAENPTAFRHYDAERKVMGKSMRAHLRFAAAFWHPFHPPRDSVPSPLDFANRKTDTAFEMFVHLGMSFFCLDETDVGFAGGTDAEQRRHGDAVFDHIAKRSMTTGIKPLWGKVNINPDRFASQDTITRLTAFMDRLKDLEAMNYVLSSAQAPYERDAPVAAQEAGRIVQALLDHKEKIGFQGAVLFEPSYQGAKDSRHDFDVENTHAFLDGFGGNGAIQLTLDHGAATMAGYRFDQELQRARACGMFGAISLNSANPRPGREPGQFVTDVAETARTYFEVLQAGGFTTGGTGFDAKLYQHPLPPDALVQTYIAAMDACAMGLLAAADLIDNGRLD